MIIRSRLGSLNRAGPGDDSVIAFTPFGIENLQELIEMDRDRAR